MRYAIFALVAFLAALPGLAHGQEARRMSPRALADQIVAEIPPMETERGDRLPLIVWRLQNIPADDEADLEQLMRALNERGIAAVSGWTARNMERRREQAMRTAAVQKRAGMPVVVNATGVMYRFFDGSEGTGHVGEDGEEFFDTSFSEHVAMGCPFALEHRYPAIRAQMEAYVEAYAEAGLPLDIVIGDWEIDGPIEWNDAWQNSRKCVRCRENVANIENFGEFQASLRTIRARMQRECFVEPVKRRYPDALVGNYAVYPHGGVRYWYDYFEREPGDDMPYIPDQAARYRPWFHEFSMTGYSFAMPVVYTWRRIFDWYDFENLDYRWFYNMLLVASNAAWSTSARIPIISFVHWHTTAPGGAPPVPQFSEEKYQELLWHMLLRGHSGLAMWCRPEETLKETQLLREVYEAALEHREFLEEGVPVNYDVPRQQGPVVSGLRLGDRVLTRRTDFDDSIIPVAIPVGEKQLIVGRWEGENRILELE